MSTLNLPVKNRLECDTFSDNPISVTPPINNNRITDNFIISTHISYYTVQVHSIVIQQIVFDDVILNFGLGFQILGLEFIETGH